METFISKTFTSYNPKTGAVAATYPVMNSEEVARAVDRMRHVHTVCAEPGFDMGGQKERRERLIALRASIAADTEVLAHTVSTEIGKPMQEALGADLLALICALDWLIAHMPRLLAQQDVPGERNACLWPAPYGVVGIIGTWNYPLLLDGTTIAWALAAGNTVVWKPSELATASALALYSHFQRAGLPVELVLGDGITGSALCAMPLDKLAFTGGVATGRKILSQLAVRGTPSVMELSGNDALIVCTDADIEATARAAVWARICNSGQSCVSPQRIYVVSSVYEPFVQLCRRFMKGLRAGVDYGPLRTDELRRNAQSLVCNAEGQGARLLAGGHSLAASEFAGGYYYAPTLLVDTTDAMPIMQQDFFGPVLCVRAVSSEEEAITAANNNDMGLGASVWTKDVARGLQIAQRLRAGIVTVNTETLMTGARPGLPFGGTGASGFGRQRGAAGLNEFLSWKTVCWQGKVGAQRHVFPYREATLPILRGMIALKTAQGMRAKLQAGREMLDAARKWNQS